MNAYQRKEGRELTCVDCVLGIEAVQELLYKILPKYYKLSIVIILYMNKLKHKKGLAWFRQLGCGLACLETGF